MPACFDAGCDDGIDAASWKCRTIRGVVAVPIVTAIVRH